jgi:hypothetical protein
MEKNLVAMGAQLKLWSLKIDDMVARTQMAGVHTSFETLMYIDELKVLHATVQLKLSEKTLAKAELEDAWNALVAAFEKPAR